MVSQKQLPGLNEVTDEETRSPCRDFNWLSPENRNNNQSADISVTGKLKFVTLLISELYLTSENND